MARIHGVRLALIGSAYLDDRYVRAMRHDGRGEWFSCGCWLVVDEVDGWVDGRSVYPGLFGCTVREAADCAKGLVSLALITWPDRPEADVVKVIGYEHLLHPLSRPSRHHTDAIARAQQRVTVRVGTADDLIGVYRHLRRRHNVTGTEDYPDECIRELCALDSARVVKAVAGTETVCAQLWLVADGWAHYAIGGSTPLGYDLEASYAVTHETVRSLLTSQIAVDLGRTPPGSKGLADFKRGWGSQVEPVYFAGVIQNPAVYEDLAARRGASDWFPAYRNGRT